MKVSVLMIAYNQEKYISQAIESALMQEVNFEYEIVIGEDNSADSTLQILQKYSENNPHVIRLFPAAQNLGFQKNFFRTLKECSGEYIALLEGDDYWTSPDKLQKQVDFFNGHPECAICFHNVNIVNEESKVIKDSKLSGQKKISSIEDLVKHNFIITCSVMFRGGLVNNIPDWFYTLPMIDWPFLILIAQFGKIGYIDEILAAYRKHPAGAWNRLSYDELLQNRIMGYEAINSYLDYKYEETVRPLVDNLWNRLNIFYVEQGFQCGISQRNVKDVSMIFSGWPSSLDFPSQWKSDVFGEIYERLLFASYSAGDLDRAKYWFVKLAQFNPRGLINRGVLSVTCEAFLGRRVANMLRKKVKFIN